MVEPGTPPETLGFREFADYLRCKPGYVTQLRQAGRLVLTEDKRRVRVAESLRLIEDTRDPSKIGVVDRHAANRADASLPSGRAVDDDAGNDDSGEELPPARADDPHSKRRAKAMADREEALARKALRDEQVELGQLLVRDDVVAVASESMTLLRTTLEQLPATMAPELAAAADEARCRALLTQAIEHALEEAARKLAALGRPA